VAAPTLIYCADGNKALAEIARAHGYEYGARLPGTIHFPLYFADQDWKKPDRERYMAALEREHPSMATVLDWERGDQLAEVLDWAEEAAQYVAESVLLIPKVFSGISRLPREIGGKRIVLAYSVPSRYGGTEVPVWEFAGWPIHLLGGSPQAQLRAWRYLHNLADVVSADGNYAQRMAVRGCQFYSREPIRAASHRHWPTLEEAGGRRMLEHPIHEAFRRSCLQIREAWAVETGTGWACG
jgi:hypothetical protein